MTTHDDVPASVGARWRLGDNVQCDGYSRSLVWRRPSGPGRMAVNIDGRQQNDGSFTRHISLWPGRSTNSP
jgi:hypothetical protein